MHVAAWPPPDLADNSHSLLPSLPTAGRRSRRSARRGRHPRRCASYRPPSVSSTVPWAGRVLPLSSGSTPWTSMARLLGSLRARSAQRRAPEAAQARPAPCCWAAAAPAAAAGAPCRCCPAASWRAAGQEAASWRGWSGTLSSGRRRARCGRRGQGATPAVLRSSWRSGSRSDATSAWSGGLCPVRLAIRH